MTVCVRVCVFVCAKNAFRHSRRQNENEVKLNANNLYYISILFVVAVFALASHNTEYKECFYALPIVWFLALQLYQRVCRQRHSAS